MTKNCVRQTFKKEAIQKDILKQNTMKSDHFQAYGCGIIFCVFKSILKYLSSPFCLARHLHHK